MRDTPEFAAAWLGAVYAGAVAVAINNRLSETEYRHILADTQARLVLVEDVFALARPDFTAELAAQKRLALAGNAAAAAPRWRELLSSVSPASAPFDAAPDTPALRLYSSGTTGRPKGILHGQRAIAAVGESVRAFGITGEDRFFATSRLFFSYGMEHGLLAPLALGASAVLCPDWPDEDAVLALCERHRPTVLFSVPTMYRRLLAERRGALAALAGIRRFVAAGERLSPQLVGQWRETTGGEMLSLYGMSETFCAAMVTAPGASNGLRTGRPLPGVEVKLLDSEEKPAAPSEPGILWLRHPALALGYVNLPEQTQAQFKDGWFCSRDRFLLDDEGYFLHQGRADELVKIAGQWVQPGEIEEAACTAPEVLEAACVPVIDREGLERLALFVTPRADDAAAREAASAACERALPRHKRPKWVRAVAELPRTATGKIQRFKLREILQAELAPSD